MSINELHNYGVKAVADAIQHGRCLGQEMTLMTRFIRPGQVGIFEGAVSGLLGAVLQIRDQGWLQPFQDDDLNDFFFGNSSTRMALELTAAYSEADKSRFERLLSYMAGVVNANRYRIRTLAPQAMDVLAEDRTLNVRIVSTPITQAVQVVERNAEDEIVRTVTTTKSAAD